MTPLPFVWPYWLIFWSVFLWAFSPEFKIVQKARKDAKRPESLDGGSVRVLVLGGSLAMFIAFPLARVHALRVSEAWQMAAFVTGTAMVIGGSLLRRHCWRQLGASFTGDVRAERDQRIVTTGAYAVVRHPSYTAGIIMNVGIGVALGSWGSTLVLIISTVLVYKYRMDVEERALLTAIGEPYREFMRTRRRLIPYIY